MLPSFAYLRAASLDAAMHQLAAEGARVHAGGTDLIGCLRDEVFDATTVVSIAELAELRGIASQPGGGLRIGALTTVAQVAADAIVRD